MRILGAALAAGLVLAGCGLGRPTLRDGFAEGGQGLIELRETPFFPQEVHQCGPAALATVLVNAGAQVTPETLAGQVYLPGRRGSLQVELLAAVRRQGLVPYPIDPGVPALEGELGAGRPVLVLLELGIPIYTVWHYAVVIGRDPRSGAVILRSGSTRRKLMSQQAFRAAWGRGGNWGLVVLPPGELAAEPDRSRYLEAVAALESVGQYGPAEAAYWAALRIWPDDPTALLGIGNSRYGMRDLKGAEQGFRRLIQIHPSAIPAHNNLAQVMAEQGKRREALVTIAQGLTLTPKGHPLRATLEETRTEIAQGMPGEKARRS